MVQINHKSVLLDEHLESLYQLRSTTNHCVYTPRSAICFSNLNNFPSYPMEEFSKDPPVTYPNNFPSLVGLVDVFWLKV